MQGDPIQVRHAEDGTVLYHLPFSAADLPPVFNRDLHAAWDASRRASLESRPGAVRMFRFDDAATLALSDRDARCWAAAVDRTTGLSTAYGVSVLLRLLALVDLLARSHAPGRTATPPARPRRRGPVVEPSPALLRAASSCRMTGDARLDETRLRHALAPSGVPA